MVTSQIIQDGGQGYYSRARTSGVMTASQGGGGGSLDGLPKPFVNAMRTLFDIMDDQRTGFVRFSDIERRWQDDGTQGMPRGVLGSLRKVTPPDGYLSFERFCAGLQISLLRNKMDDRSSASSLGSVISKGAPPPLPHSRPPSAPLLDEPTKEHQPKRSVPGMSVMPRSSSHHRAERTMSMPQLDDYPQDPHPHHYDPKDPHPHHYETKDPHPHYDTMDHRPHSKPDIKMGVGGILSQSKSSGTLQGPPKPPRVMDRGTHSLDRNLDARDHRGPSGDMRGTHSLERDHTERKWPERVERTHRERERSEYVDYRRERSASTERLLDPEDKSNHVPLCRAGIRSALQTWHKERSKGDLADWHKERTVGDWHKERSKTDLAEVWQKERSKTDLAETWHKIRNKGDLSDWHKDRTKSDLGDNNNNRPAIEKEFKETRVMSAMEPVGRGVGDGGDSTRPGANSQPEPSTATYMPQPAITTANITTQPSTSIANITTRPSTSIANITTQPSTSTANLAAQPTSGGANLATQATKRASRRREPRRHTLQNGIDFNMVKRLKQFEAERDMLVQGYEVVERARNWYRHQLQLITDGIRNLPQGPPRQEPSLEAQQEKLHFQLARIHEVNAHLQALMAASERGLPTHMNLAIRPTTQPSAQPSAQSSSQAQPRDPEQDRMIDRLKDQNHLLTEEVSTKSERITALEREKAALLRELFQARSHHLPQVTSADSTFM